MKVINMKSPRGNVVPNQFIIQTKTPEGNKVEYFQSYETLIAKAIYDSSNFGVAETYLDQEYYNYSRTTSKYLHMFLLDRLGGPVNYDALIYTNLNNKGVQ